LQVSTSVNQLGLEILSPDNAAKRVGLSVSMLAKMRCLGGGPAYLKLGRAVRYRQDDLDAWLAARRVRNTSDAERLPSRLTDTVP
jgi:predicted DNA-binding transcriptional regulator AlpA